MHQYIGRLAGGVVGAIGGVPGALFGFLLGLLIDRVRVATWPRRRLAGLAAHPHAVRSADALVDGAALLWGVAVTRVDGARSPVSASALLVALREVRPHSHDSWVSNRMHELAEEAVKGRIQPDDARLVDALRRRCSESQLEDVVRVLVRIAANGAGGVSAAARAYVVGLNRALALADTVWRDAEAAVGSLDRRACTVLGIEPTANADHVRRAYRSLAAQFHPDTAPELDAERRAQLADTFARIQAAYELLSAQLTDRDAEFNRTR